MKEKRCIWLVYWAYSASFKEEKLELQQNRNDAARNWNRIHGRILFIGLLPRLIFSQLFNTPENHLPICETSQCPTSIIMQKIELHAFLQYNLFYVSGLWFLLPKEWSVLSFHYIYIIIDILSTQQIHHYQMLTFAFYIILKILKNYLLNFYTLYFILPLLYTLPLFHITIPLTLLGCPHLQPHLASKLLGASGP